ncbi:MAG: flagellum-specific ATP synthase [Myxococcota bacterium]|jgi:flagellum-specific ATP synthase
MSAALDQSFHDGCLARVVGLEPVEADGRVCSLVGILIEGEGIPAQLGSVCLVEPGNGTAPFEAEVVGFREKRFLLMPLAEHMGVAPGARLRLSRTRSTVPVGASCLGRVLDGLGRPIDGGAPLDGAATVPLYRAPESAVTRDRIQQPLDLGVRAINSFCTVGCGMRMGIFAGSGVGKSSLLGQIARHTDADVAVIALIGERRREVREFIERDLGDSISRSVVVVSTSDEAPLLRVRAAHAATAIAESFRDEGKNVLLMMDSVTRFCTALREIGLATGEPPTTRGYTPSVFTQLPRLFERAGTSENGGSITGIYTVLVEGDDMNEPVADASRSLLDGHIALSRRLAERGHFPSIDVLSSISRVMTDIVPQEHVDLARAARVALSTYADAEDLISIGAYQSGSDASIDVARNLNPALQKFLQQRPEENSSIAESLAALGEIFTPSAVVASL